MPGSRLALVAVAVLVAACDAPLPTAPGIEGPMTSARTSPILHRVSAGSPDAAGPGADANYSILATQRSDGTVTGQYTDQWKDGRGSIHVTVDCLHVVGNRAWVGGVVTGGTSGDLGQFILTMVEDNGTGAGDPPDQIAASYYTDGTITCEAAPELPLLPLHQGQVTVR